MRRFIVSVGLAPLLALFLSLPVLAQSGHFVTGGKNDPQCVDGGTRLTCVGKVSGLGGTTFEITVESQGTAIVECRNPGGNVAPGQDTTITASASTGPQPTPRNGNFNFSLATAQPVVPNVPTCPNPQWRAEVVDVIFGPATVTLFEDGVQVDQIII
jgi:hypothetical protein